MLRVLPFLGVVACVSAGAPTPPCAAPPGIIPVLNSSLCYEEVAPKNPSGVEIRKYGFVSNATFVSGSSTGAFPSGIQNAIATVISYLSGNNDDQRNILNARTVPFIIQTVGPWTANMEIDPTQFPDDFLIPRPLPRGPTLSLVSNNIDLMAVFQFNTTGFPYIENIEEACGVIQNSTLPSGYAINTTHPFTPSYVFYQGQSATEFQSECWMAVYAL